MKKTLLATIAVGMLLASPADAKILEINDTWQLEYSSKLCYLVTRQNGIDVGVYTFDDDTAPHGYVSSLLVVDPAFEGAYETTVGTTTLIVDTNAPVEAEVYDGGEGYALMNPPDTFWESYLRGDVLYIKDFLGEDYFIRLEGQLEGLPHWQTCVHENLKD